MTFHFPAGVNREAWRASGIEDDWSLGVSQRDLLRHKADVTVVRNVDASGDKSGNSVHTGRIATFLTAGDVPMSTRAMGTSADQLVAQALQADAGATPFRSLELGTSILNENPNKEPGWDPVLKDHLSWWNGTPLPKEISPAALFDRLFAAEGADPEVARVRRILRKSVLDGVHEEATRLQVGLGRSDRVKLDEYLTGVRELERRVDATTHGYDPSKRPAPPKDVRDRVKQMLDLSVLAFELDLTRVVTFGYEHTVTEQAHPWLGVNEGYHIGITHNDPGPKYVAVNAWIVSQLAYLLDQLAAKRDPDGSRLLDNTIVYFASEMGEGSTHSKKDLPIVVCGGGRGTVRKGRLLDRPGQGNGNVLLALMRAMGVTIDTFGNGFTQSLPGLVSVSVSP
jgi:hypothetical protein